MSRQSQLGRVAALGTLLLTLWTSPMGPVAMAGPVRPPAAGAKKKPAPHDGHKSPRGGKAGNPSNGQARPPVPGTVADPGPLPSAPTEPRVERLTLPSGLAVAVLPAPEEAAVTIVLRFASGSASDPKGHGGTARTAAELLRLGESDLSRALLDRGGTLQVSAERDATTFVLRLPPHELDLALSSELERLAPLVADPARLAEAKGILARANGLERSEDRLESLVFQGYAPYERPRTGTDAERDAVSVVDVETFARTHFVSTNATLVVSGRIDAKRTLALVHQRFAGGSEKPKPLGAEAAKLEEQTNQRSGEIVDDGAATTLLFGWAIPHEQGRDAAKLEMAAALLSWGPSARLTRALEELGARAEATVEQRKGPGLFTLRVELPGGADPAPARRAIESALTSLGKDPVQPREIERARRAVWTKRLDVLRDPVERSTALAEGDFGLTEERARLEASDAAAVRDAFAKYLGPLRRTRLVVHASHVDAQTSGGGTKPVPAPLAAKPPLAKPAQAKPAGKPGQASATPESGQGVKSPLKKDEPKKPTEGPARHPAKTKAKTP